MKLESVRIQNLRSIKDQKIHFDDFTCFVGPNGAGKSNVLCALNLFFGESSNNIKSHLKLEEEDFHQKNTENPIEVTLTFTELNEEAKKDFKDYFRQEKLVISIRAEYDQNTKLAEVKQIGKRFGMPEFKPYFKTFGDNGKADILKEIYSEIKEKFNDLPPASSREKMKDALIDYEKNKPDLCELIPSEDQFYGVSKGKNLLQKYILWIHVPAVKDAVDEQNEAKNTSPDTKYGLCEHIIICELLLLKLCRTLDKYFA